MAALAAAGIAVAGLAAVGLARGWWRMNHPDPSRFPVWGVDVSRHQGEIDWASVAREPRIAFAYLKATEGGDWIDPGSRPTGRARAGRVDLNVFHGDRAAPNGL
jgi:Glycosyl hydrolases family 25